GNLLTPVIGAQRGIGGEQDAFRQRDRLSLREAREWRDQQAFHAERRPVALCVLDQLVGFGDPDRLTPSAQPVVEDDRGRLAALASSGPVTEHEAPAKPDRTGSIFWRSAHIVEMLVYGPST